VEEHDECGKVEQLGKEPKEEIEIAVDGHMQDQEERSPHCGIG